jgi:hypothetical protein
MSSHSGRRAAKIEISSPPLFFNGGFAVKRPNFMDGCGILKYSQIQGLISRKYRGILD